VWTTGKTDRTRGSCIARLISSFLQINSFKPPSFAIGYLLKFLVFQNKSRKDSQSSLSIIIITRYCSCSYHSRNSSFRDVHHLKMILKDDDDDDDDWLCHVLLLSKPYSSHSLLVQKSIMSAASKQIQMHPIKYAFQLEPLRMAMSSLLAPKDVIIIIEMTGTFPERFLSHRNFHQLKWRGEQWATPTTITTSQYLMHGCITYCNSVHYMLVSHFVAAVAVDAEPLSHCFRRISRKFSVKFYLHPFDAVEMHRKVSSCYKIDNYYVWGFEIYYTV